MARLYFSRTLQRLVSKSAALDRRLRRVDADVLQLIGKVSAALPVERASAVGDALGRKLGPRLRQHEHVQRNLRLAFPDRDEAWVASTGRAIWGRIFATLAEYPHLPAIAGERGEPRVEVASHFDLGPAQRGEQRLMLVAIHQANWNVHAITGRLAGLPVSVFFARHNNAQVEAVVGRYRSRMPCGFIDVADGLRGVLAALDRGDHVGMFVDARHDRQPMVPFFGHPAPTTVWPARLALKLGLAMVPVRLERLPGVRFRATFHAPLTPPPDGTHPAEAAAIMTAQLNGLFEQWIEDRPEDWICAKRRWPTEIWKRRRNELRAAGRIRI
jgi:KDO2-lipid IV(A) lauroyltransferase